MYSQISSLFNKKNLFTSELNINTEIENEFDLFSSYNISSNTLSPPLTRNNSISINNTSSSLLIRNDSITSRSRNNSFVTNFNLNNNSTTSNSRPTSGKFNLNSIFFSEVYLIFSSLFLYFLFLLFTHFNYF